MTEASKKDDVILEKVSCIYYPIWFKKDKIRVLIYSGNKVNAITPIHISKLGFKTRHTNFKAQKIDGSTLEIFEIVLTSF